MSSETTELTFVRCPSCRSLVPATATRCRICNNPLDGGNKADESDAAKAAGRIRQKTISASADEVAGALAEVNAAPAAPTPPAPPVQPSPIVNPTGTLSAEDDSDLDFDPLGAYLQELEEAEESESSKVPSVKEGVLGQMDSGPVEVEEDLDPFGLDIFDEPDNQPAPKPVAPTPAPESADAPVRPAVAAAPRSPQPEPVRQNELSAEPVRTQQPAQPPPAKEAPEARRPFGVPAQAGRQGGAPEAPRPERQAPPRPSEHRQRDDHSQEPRRAKDSPPPRPANNQQNQPQGKRDARGEQRHEAPKGNRSGHEQRPNPNGEGRQPDRGNNGSPRPGKISPGRLFGWLVSYENPDGRAIELREGKFFVTGSSIKATDLVIEDASISTPHALMSVSGESGLKIQDLMSERGLFVRSREGGQYRREEGTVELKHGDWVRFGDVEFLVTVVPSGSGR
jgi:hypothetical protein